MSKLLISLPFLIRWVCVLRWICELFLVVGSESHIFRSWNLCCSVRLNTIRKMLLSIRNTSSDGSRAHDENRPNCIFIVFLSLSLSDSSRALVSFLPVFYTLIHFHPCSVELVYLRKIIFFIKIYKFYVLSFGFVEIVFWPNHPCYIVTSYWKRWYDLRVHAYTNPISIQFSSVGRSVSLHSQFTIILRYSLQYIYLYNNFSSTASLLMFEKHTFLDWCKTPKKFRRYWKIGKKLYTFLCIVPSIWLKKFLGRANIYYVFGGAKSRTIALEMQKLTRRSTKGE